MNNEESKVNPPASAVADDAQIIAKHDPSCRHRAKVELAIVHRLLADLLAAGYTLSVHDGEEITLGDERTLVNAIFAVDESRILTKKSGALGNLEFRNSFVFLVLGNGHDVISDYGVSLEAVIEPIMTWIDAQMDNGTF